MNHKSLVRIMNLLDIASVDLARELFVSPSHISRWKNGSRELKESSKNYLDLEKYILSVNSMHADRRLEQFLISEQEGRELSEAEEKALLKQKLRRFMTDESQAESMLQRREEASNFRVLVGLDERIEALKSFFEYVMTLNPKPDLYIKEVLYASWCPRQIDWFSLCHEYALKYMNAGGVIYYFSNLNNIDRTTFYGIWEFTRHKNLYPGYSANMAEESPACAFYLAEGVRSVTFYAPEDNPKNYITAVCSDKLMLSAEENYLKNLYEQRQHQIFINTMENQMLMLGIIRLHQKKHPPLLFAGDVPGFFLMSSKTLKNVLKENNVSAEALNYSMKLQELFMDQVRDRAIPKTFFYYLEDLRAFAGEEDIPDIALTAIVGKAIYLTRAVREEMLKALKECCLDTANTVRIVSKEDKSVYDALGDTVTLWVKRGDWYIIFYPDREGQTDERLITDSLACTLRYDLYYSTLLNIKYDPHEVEEILEGIMRQAT